ncbi:MAG: GAF domain-containing sensor histidine kinase [Anaerolineales bacterium]|nr:GAF domain-containing sensor histidine kinase [Anaerolineales bacterium]
MLANTYDALARQLQFSEALAKCSRTLLHGSLGAEINPDVLNEALNYLLLGFGISRIGVFEAHWADDIGPHTIMIAEAAALPLTSRLEQLRDARIPTTPEICRQLLTSQTVSVTLRDLDYSPEEQVALDIRSLLLCPIFVDGQYWGNLAYGDALDDRHWSEHEVMLLQTAAEMFGSTLQNWRSQAQVLERQREAISLNSQLYERAQQVAVLEERQRLSRELHDSVTQTLYSLVLLADGGQRLARAGRLESVDEYLADLGAIALQSLKEMRLLVHELRPSLVSKESLIDCLRERLHGVEDRAGVTSRLLVDDDVVFTTAENEAIWGIAQEALNNALKYAHAKTVVVHVWGDDHGRGVDIADDGIGFAMGDLPGIRGIGLSTMHERSEAGGAVLTISSAPGAGTQGRVEIPL